MRATTKAAREYNYLNINFKYQKQQFDLALILKLMKHAAHGGTWAIVNYILMMIIIILSALVKEYAITIERGRIIDINHCCIH